MIRQVLYSWGKLYFPWGIEDVDTACEIIGLRIADPLSGNWECVEIVPGNNKGFDSVVFKYMPHEWDLPPGRGRGPTGRVLPDGKICFNADGTLAYPIHPAWRDADPYPVGPETQSVNSAVPQDDFLRADFVLRQFNTHIRWSRNYEEANVLRHLKEALGL